jgi:hypothetical protein
MNSEKLCQSECLLNQSPIDDKSKYLLIMLEEVVTTLVRFKDQYKDILLENEQLLNRINLITKSYHEEIGKLPEEINKLPTKSVNIDLAHEISILLHKYEKLIYEYTECHRNNNQIDHNCFDRIRILQRENDRKSTKIQELNHLIQHKDREIEKLTEAKLVLEEKLAELTEENENDLYSLQRELEDRDALIRILKRRSGEVINDNDEDNRNIDLEQIIENVSQGLDQEEKCILYKKIDRKIDQLLDVLINGNPNEVDNNILTVDNLIAQIIDVIFGTIIDHSSIYN